MTKNTNTIDLFKAVVNNDIETIKTYITEIITQRANKF